MFSCLSGGDGCICPPSLHTEMRLPVIRLVFSFLPSLESSPTKATELSGKFHVEALTIFALPFNYIWENIT